MHLCHSPRVATIADFVENEETANSLRVLKVRDGQGYFFGKPRLPPWRLAENIAMRRVWPKDRLGWRRDMLYCFFGGIAWVDRACDLMPRYFQKFESGRKVDKSL